MLKTDFSTKNVSSMWDNIWKEIDVKEHIYDVNENSNNPWIRSHYPFVLKEVKKLKKGSKILEAGCGLGQWVFFFGKFDHFSIGIDITKNALFRANKFMRSDIFFSEKKVYFICNDLRYICCKDNFFDYLFSFGVIEHVSDPTPMLSEFYRVLAINGKALITVPNTYSIHTITRPISQLLHVWNIGYETSYSPKKLKKIVGKVGLNVVEYGVIPSGEMFGLFTKYIPLVGKALFKILNKLSFYIEEKQNTFGFISYVIVEKID